MEISAEIRWKCSFNCATPNVQFERITIQMGIVSNFIISGRSKSCPPRRVSQLVFHILLHLICQSESLIVNKGWVRRESLIRQRLDVLLLTQKLKQKRAVERPKAKFVCFAAFDEVRRLLINRSRCFITQFGCNSIFKISLTKHSPARCLQLEREINLPSS
jgi:hypothetical protein